MASITYSELQERYAFYLEEPWGYDMENFRMGMVASVVANVAGSKTQPADFYPKSMTTQTSNENTDPQGLLTLFQSLKSSKDKE